MQVSPYKTKPKVPQPSAFDMALGFAQVAELSKELQALRDNHKSIIDTHTAEFEKTIADKIAEIDAVLKQVVEYHAGSISDKLAEVDDVIADIKEIDFTGAPGTNADPVDYDKIITAVRAMIPNPQDGRDAFVNEDSIIKRVLSKIPKPEAVKVKPVDHQVIVDKIFEILDSGEKKLSVKHIGDFTTGLEQTIAPIRSLAAGFRGGGDVVKAGNNIIVTVDADGKKVIASTGGIIYTETPTGAIDGSNKVYTTAHSITTVIGLWINGQFIHPSEYVVSGSGFTMNTALDVSLSGTSFTISYA